MRSPSFPGTVSHAVDVAAETRVALLGSMLLLLSAPSGCSQGHDGGGPDGGIGGPSPGCPVPGTPATWRIVNGGVAGPPAAPLTCQRPVRTAALGAAQVQALGVHAVGETVRFTVAPGTAGFSIVSQSSSGTVDTITFAGHALRNSVVPTLLRQPDGQTLFDDSASVPSDPTTAFYLFRGGPPSTGVMTIPNTTRALTAASPGLPSGEWSFEVNDYALECLASASCSGGTDAGRYDVTVITRPPPYQTGTVDLSFYLVTSTLGASEATTDVHVQRFLSTLGQIYASAGLCLGTITFHDVPSWARARYATSIDISQAGPCDDLAQMFTLSQPGNALEFFLVDDLVQGTTPVAGGVLVGEAAAIPGPSGIAGTTISGAVVSIADLAHGDGCQGPPRYGTSPDGGAVCGADATAYVTAHEGGHWMGLLHTTEATGVTNDPLSDTPVCQCATACGVSAAALGCCVDPATHGFSGSCPSMQPTVLTATNCLRDETTCGGARNLMFWLVEASSVGDLSSQQSQVIRANPVVH